jgi:hypothetical protein
MKQIFLTGLTAIYLLVAGITANGQLAGNDMHPSGDFTFFKKDDSKNFPGFAAKNSVNSRAIRNFIQSYKGVSNEQWFEVKDGFVAMFSLNDVDYQVAYDKKGNLLRTIRTYGEGKLSQDLRHVVKSTYYDYNINLVQEIEKPLSPVIYIIQLVGKTELINLKICDGEIEVLQKFNKAE